MSPSSMTVFISTMVSLSCVQSDNSNAWIIDTLPGTALTFTVASLLCLCLALILLLLKPIIEITFLRNIQSEISYMYLQLRCQYFLCQPIGTKYSTCQPMRTHLVITRLIDGCCHFWLVLVSCSSDRRDTGTWISLRVWGWGCASVFPTGPGIVTELGRISLDTVHSPTLHCPHSSPRNCSSLSQKLHALQLTQLGLFEGIDNLMRVRQLDG